MPKMNKISYREDKNIERDALLNLYNDAAWTAYTDKPEELENAISNSLYVCIAMDKEKLVGLIRIIGDRLTIIYIQDILVLNSYKRNGIGTALMLKALDKFKTVRQKVLLTDDNIGTRGFYESLGFISSEKARLVSFVKFESIK